jgi:hypothetical protein
MTQELIQGLQRALDHAFDGARDGLRGAAAGVTLDMRSSPAHGDQTGASHANYNARVVGRGEDGSQQLGVARAAATALNPGEVGPTQSVSIAGVVGVIMDSQMEYSPKLETEAAGEKSVIGPTVASSGQRFTQAAARGSKKAWGG